MATRSLVTRLRSKLYRECAGNQWVSFPKSGRTWLREVLEAYFAESAEQADFDFDTWTPFLPVGAWSKAPGIHFNHAVYRAEDPVAFERAIDRLAGRRVLFQVRDPRDVIVTYYFQRVRMFQDAEARALELSEFVRDPTYGVGAVVAYMNAWFRAQARFSGFHLLRYEGARDDPTAALEQVFAFLGWTLEAERLARALEGVPDRTRSVEHGGLPLIARLRAGEADPGPPREDWRSLELAPASEGLSASDRAYIEARVAELEPGVGYSAASPSDPVVPAGR